MCITLHFSGLNPNFHLSDHDVKLLRSFCSTSPSSNDEIRVQTFVSSANILTLLLIHSGMSFTKTTKSRGPNTEPWGTPLDTSTQSECDPLTWTFILRPCRKDLIHANNCPIHQCHILEALLVNHYAKLCQKLYGSLYHIYAVFLVDCRSPGLKRL